MANIAGPKAIAAALRFAAPVPCSGCTKCCWTAVMLHPELGDRLEDYQLRVVVPGIGWKLMQRSDGGCGYLGPEGCTIYDDRPALCRAFDCRQYAKLQWQHNDPLKRPEVIARGEELLDLQDATGGSDG